MCFETEGSLISWDVLCLFEPAVEEDYYGAVRRGNFDCRKAFSPLLGTSTSGHTLMETCHLFLLPEPAMRDFKENSNIHLQMLS